MNRHRIITTVWDERYANRLLALMQGLAPRAKVWRDGRFIWGEISANKQRELSDNADGFRIGFAHGVEMCGKP